VVSFFGGSAIIPDGPDWLRPKEMCLCQEPRDTLYVGWAQWENFQLCNVFASWPFVKTNGLVAPYSYKGATYFPSLAKLSRSRQSLANTGLSARSSERATKADPLAKLTKLDRTAWTGVC
jgi:hypothetical protein